MARTCELTEEIFSNIEVTCSVPEGFEDKAYFMLRKDVDFAGLAKAESASTQPNTYCFADDEHFVKVSGAEVAKDKVAIVMQLKNAFSGTTSEFQEGDSRNTITNTVSFNVWSSDPNASKQLDAMLNGTYVAVLKQVYKGNEDNSGYAGGAVYRVYGVTGSGLKCTGMSNDPYADSLGNGWVVTFTEEGATNTMKFLQAKDADGELSEVTTDAWVKKEFGE